MAVTTFAPYLCILLVNLFLFHITNVVAPPRLVHSVIEVNKQRPDSDGSIVPPPNINNATQTFSIQLINATDRITMIPSNDYFMGGVAIGLRPALSSAEAPVSTPGCNPSICNIVFPSVNVFYWPKSSLNTTCYSTIRYMKTRPSPPDIYMLSPTNYLVFAEPTKYDGCGNPRARLVGSMTHAVTYGALSTMQVAPLSSPKARPVGSIPSAGQLGAQITPLVPSIALSSTPAIPRGTLTTRPVNFITDTGVHDTFSTPPAVQLTTPQARLTGTGEIVYRDEPMLQALPGATPTPHLFNFEDLPCPPPEIQAQLEPGEEYTPILSPPLDSMEAFIANNAILQSFFGSCTIKAIRDPPGHAQAVSTSISPPVAGVPP